MRCKTKLNNKVPLEMCLELTHNQEPHKEMPKLNKKMCLLSQGELTHFFTKEMFLDAEQSKLINKEMHHSLEPSHSKQTSKEMPKLSKEMCHVR